MLKHFSSLLKLITSSSNDFRDISMYHDFDPDDIRTYPINEIMKSGKFTADERRQEYRRRGKSPSGVIDGVYNDANRGNEVYNDMDRDWDADA